MGTLAIFYLLLFSFFDLIRHWHSHRMFGLSVTRWCSGVWLWIWKRIKTPLPTVGRLVDMNQFRFLVIRWFISPFFLFITSECGVSALRVRFILQFILSIKLRNNICHQKTRNTSSASPWKSWGIIIFRTNLTYNSLGLTTAKLSKVICIY